MNIMSEELFLAQVDYLYHLVDIGQLTEESAKAQIELIEDINY